MKNIFLWSLLLAGLVYTCKPKESKPAPPVVPVVEGGLLTSIDTFRLTLIDSIIYTIDTTANKSGSEISLEPFIFSDQDKIRYYKKDGELWRAVVVTYPENVETRSVFYWKDGKPSFIRHREWHKHPSPAPKSMEILTYFEDGKVVAVVDREIALQPNEPPTALYPVPLKISRRPLNDVVEEYSKYRDPALKAIEEFEKTGMHRPDTVK